MARFTGGPPVVRKEKTQPATKSISQCEKFDPQCGGCPYAYKLVKKVGVRRPAFLAKFSDFGSRVHADLELGTASAPVVQPYLDAFDEWLMDNDYRPIHFEYRVGRTFDGSTKSWIGEEHIFFGHKFVIIVDCILQHLVTGRHAVADFKITSRPDGICEKLQLGTYNEILTKPHIGPLGSSCSGFDIEELYYLIFERASNLAFVKLHEKRVTDEILRGEAYRDRILPIMDGIDAAWKADEWPETPANCTDCWERQACRES